MDYLKVLHSSPSSLLCISHHGTHIIAVFAVFAAFFPAEKRQNKRRKILGLMVSKKLKVPNYDILFIFKPPTTSSVRPFSTDQSILFVPLLSIPTIQSTQNFRRNSRDILPCLLFICASKPSSVRDEHICTSRK